MSKTNKKSKTSKHLLRYVMPTIVGVLCLVAIVQSVMIYYLFKQNDVAANARVGALIVHATEGGTRPLPLDPKTGNAYISASKITLPVPPDSLGPLVYSYDQSDDGSVQTVHIAQVSYIRSIGSALMAGEESLDRAFDKVPKLQACVRGVGISTSKAAGVDDAGSKVLANGKTVYFSTEQLCKDDKLLDYVKQVNSY